MLPSHTCVCLPWESPSPVFLLWLWNRWSPYALINLWPQSCWVTGNCGQRSHESQLFTEKLLSHCALIPFHWCHCNYEILMHWKCCHGNKEPGWCHCSHGHHHWHVYPSPPLHVLCEDEISTRTFCASSHKTMSRLLVWLEQPVV